MPTAAELLAKTSSADKTLVIDNDLRMIKIPASVTNLGVESDDEVLRLHFRMPRYLGKTDLSTFAIRINYLNARGEGDVYSVSDMQIVGDNLTFSWLVGPNATAYKGDTKFNVCMKIVDGQGYIQKEYNTTIATLPVLEGLETEEGLVEFYSDILEQWKNQLFGIGDTEEAKLHEKSEEEQQKVIDKGIEVLATIPEDYQTTYKMANDAYRTRANAIVSTAQGESIVLTDSSKDPLRGLRIFGKTTQYTSSGINLLNPNAKATFLNNNGAEKTGIAIPIVESGTYTYFVRDSVTVYIGYSSSLTTNAVHFTTATKDSGISGTTTLSAGQYFLLWFDTGVSARNAQNYFLALGTDVEFEPFTNGEMAPSPEWPMELTGVNGPSISIRGKNLVHITGEPVTWNGITFTPNQDGSVTVNGTATALTYMNTAFTLAPGDYVLNGCPAGGHDSTYFIRMATTYDGLCDDRGDGANFTLTKAQSITVRIVIRPGVVADNMIFKPMVRNASVSDDTFEPFASRQILDTSYSLHGIPVTQNGNYTDHNGQQWICDEIDFERGVYIQRVGVRTFNGSEAWLIGEQNTDEGYLGVFYTAANDMVAGSTAICSHYLQGNSVGLIGKAGQFDTYYSQFRVNIDSFTTVNDWTAQLDAWDEAGTPLTLCYILTTPIETELTAEELVTFGALHTNYPNTTILNDSGAWMEVKYNEDLKMYANEIMEDAAETVITQSKIQAAVDNWLSAYYSTAEGVSF